MNTFKIKINLMFLLNTLMALIYDKNNTCSEGVPLILVANSSRQPLIYAGNNNQLSNF